MPDTSTRAFKTLEGSVASLQSTTATQDERVSAIALRLSSISDDIRDIKRELATLRENVGEDLKVLFERTK